MIKLGPQIDVYDIGCVVFEFYVVGEYTVAVESYVMTESWLVYKVPSPDRGRQY